MIENAICPIWGTPAQVTINGTRDGESYDSPRASGKFFISYTALQILNHRDVRVKAKLTSWLVEQRRLGDHKPEILSTTIDEANERKLFSVFERADRTLRYIHDQTPQIGEVIGVLINQAELDGISESLNDGITPVNLDMSYYYNALNIQAFSESTNLKEVSFLLDYLKSQKWIDLNKTGPAGICQLTVNGYGRLADLEKKDTQSSRVFVAMWFDNCMKDLWEKGIKQGIEDAGYEAVRIDRKEHVNKIDDEIIAEIKRSRFVVADFTHGIEGMRGGVYYEAGFAYGMNIPVIFSCREDIIDNIHFDTRQYNHICMENTRRS